MMPLTIELESQIEARPREQAVERGVSVETAATSTPIPADWLAEFEAAARRPLRQRFKYAFIKTYKPVLDDADYRSWETMEEYRQWCEDNLPDWLGYSRK